MSSFFEGIFVDTKGVNCSNLEIVRAKNFCDVPKETEVRTEAACKEVCNLKSESLIFYLMYNQQIKKKIVHVWHKHVSYCVVGILSNVGDTL